MTWPSDMPWDGWDERRPSPDSRWTFYVCPRCSALVTDAYPHWSWHEDQLREVG